MHKRPLNKCVNVFALFLVGLLCCNVASIDQVASFSIDMLLTNECSMMEKYC